MLSKIIKLSLDNRLAIFILTTIIIFVGIYVALNMDVDVFPDINAPTVVVMTEVKGMAPEEVEKLVTFPIETVLTGSTDVRRVRSSSATGFSIIWVEFNWGVDIYKSRQIVSEKLANIKEHLPKEASAPVLCPQSSILGEVMIVGLTSDSTSLQSVRTLADWVIRPKLLTVEGVAQITVIGGDVKEYQILLNQDKMKYYDVKLSNVMDAVRGLNQNVAAGILNEFGNEYIIRTSLSTNDIAKLGKTLIKKDNKSFVLLENIADIVAGNRSPKIGTASEKGKPAVLITIAKQPSVNTLKLTADLDKAINSLSQSLPSDVKISTDMFRQSKFIESSINNIKKSLIEGAVFVVIILLIFLMNVRTTLISLITIPLSLLVAILVLKIMGFTLNTMSLGGMAISIGLLVDDAVVDVENVYKRLKENRLLNIASRKSLKEVIFSSSVEVRIPIINSTIIIAVSFIPLFLLSGMEGRMLAPLGIAFITSILASTVVALTVTPVLCSCLLQNNKGQDNIKDTWVAVKLQFFYEKILNFAIKKKKWVLGSTAIMLIFTIIIFFTLGRSFLPPFNEGSFTVNVSTLPGTSLEESDKIGFMAEKILLSFPEIKSVGRKTGRAELDEHVLGVNVSEIEAPFTLQKRSKGELASEIREKLSILPGVNVEIGQPISHRIDAMLSGTKTNIVIKLFGTNLNEMYRIGYQIRNSIKNIKGIVDLNVEQQIDRAQLKIEPDREMLAKYGITLPNFGEYINVILAGETVSQVYEESKIFDIVVKSNDACKDKIAKIKKMFIDSEYGKVPLENVAKIASTSGPNTINHENMSRKIVISANISNRDLVSTVNEIKKQIDKTVIISDDYHIEYDGQFENEKSTSKTLLIASVFSIISIYLLLYKQFKNAIQAIVVMINLPLAIIGGIFILFFTNGDVSIPAIIGFISLFGIATRNGMLLIERYNNLIKQNDNNLIKNVILGSLDRIIPILMTSLTSALALIPIAMGGELPGNEIQSPMAKVILGGLLSSTLLNLIVIPIMYILINKKTLKNCQE